MANIRDVAKLAGVSISTVSRTLSNRVFVEEATRQKVLEAVRQLNYRPNLMAKGLKEGKSQTLGFLVPDINSLYYPMLMKHIEQCAAEKGYSLILCSNNEDIEQEKRNVEMMKNRGIDGIICMTVSDECEHMRRIKEEGIPVVLANRVEKGLDCVSIDNRHGAYLMTRHLLEQGHRRICGMFGWMDRQRFRERYEGFLQAMEQFGVEDYRPYLLRDVSSIEGACQAAMRKLSQPQPPTAFFASIDILSIGIYSGVARMGLSIPEDVSVAGFDNIFITQYMIPPLTTLEVYPGQLAQACVDSLLRQMQPGKQLQPKTHLIQGTLMQRQSVKKICDI